MREKKKKSVQNKGEGRKECITQQSNCGSKWLGLFGLVGGSGKMPAQMLKQVMVVVTDLWYRKEQIVCWSSTYVNEEGYNMLRLVIEITFKGYLECKFNKINLYARFSERIRRIWNLYANQRKEKSKTH